MAIWIVLYGFIELGSVFQMCNTTMLGVIAIALCLLLLL